MDTSPLNTMDTSPVPLPVPGMPVGIPSGGISSVGIPSVRPAADIVNEVDQHLGNARQAMSPEAGAAFDKAHESMGSPLTTPVSTPAVAPVSHSLGSPSPAPITSALSLSPVHQELNRLETTPSGVGGIHNAWGRVPLQILDALGRSVAPGIEQGIPGTQGHHDYLVRQGQKAVAGEDASTEAAARAGLQHQQATSEAERTAEAAAAAPGLREHTGAETEGLKAGIAKTGAETAEIAPNGESNRALQGANTEHINAETAALRNEKYTLQHVESPDGSVHALVFDPKTGSVKTEQVYRGDPKIETEVTQLEVNGQTHSMLVNKKTGEHIKDLGPLGARPTSAPPPDHGQNFVDPATGKMVRVEPGGAVPKGAVTAGGLNTETVAGDKETKAAAKARTDAQHEYELAQKLAANPSPTNDVALLMRYIGATKPDSLGKLRLNQNEIGLVLGTRSSLGDLEALEQKVVNGQKLVPQQRKDMLASMKLLAGVEDGGGSKAPLVKTKAEFDALAPGAKYTEEDGKTYTKPGKK